MQNVNSESWTIVIVGYLIVFIALVSLVLIFRSTAFFLTRNLRKKMKRKGKDEGEKGSLHVSGEASAAISMALYLHFNDIHDEESKVITIKRVERRYSPWSSKIYGLRNHPR